MSSYIEKQNNYNKKEKRMKKVVIVLATVVALTSCDMIGGGRKQLEAENDSLMAVLANRNAELDEMLSTFNDISEGFRQINAAESRVDLQRYAVSEGSLNAKEQLTNDIEFIRKQMEENREQIAKLQEQLKKSNNQSSQLRRAVEQLTKELEDKAQHIENLRAELAAKNIQIQELDMTVKALAVARKELADANEAKAETISRQDQDLHTAWFVFGTKSELKEKNILRKSEVLTGDKVDFKYFTKIDIRSTNQIRLFAKGAELLTSHPQSSYIFEKDDQGELTLKITNTKEFWSISKYLVIQVKKTR